MLEDEFINREIKKLILTGSQFGNDLHFKEDSIEETIRKTKIGLYNLHHKTIKETLEQPLETIENLSRNLLSQNILFGFSSCLYFHGTNDLKIHIIGGKDNHQELIHINSAADLASISKLFLLLLIYKMVDEYKEFRLEETLFQYDQSLQGIKDYTFLDAIKMSSHIETSEKINFHSINQITKEEAQKIINTMTYIEKQPQENHYTDIVFIKLAQIVTKIYNHHRQTEYTFEQIIQREILEPSNMKNSGYHLTKNIFGNGNTENLLQDPKTRILGGCSGSAGLFVPSTDLCNFAQAILDLKIISFTRLTEICSVHFPQASNFCRGIAGIYVKDPRGRNKNFTPNRFSNLSFSHQGFTGTEFMIDYQNQMHYHFLPNAIPNGKEKNMMIITPS